MTTQTHLLALQAGQGWKQVGELALAFALSSLIGLEREVHQKSAGLRTHALVGIGAAVFLLVSKYGFADVLASDKVVLDPSRVAAQIVTGIGFIGGGVIFVRRDLVRGLTTAASVWLTAAVGMAAGAGLPVLAALATAAHFGVAWGLTPLARWLPRSKWASTTVRVDYRDGEGALRRILPVCTQLGFTVSELNSVSPRSDLQSTVSVLLLLSGAGSVTELAAELSEVDGVVGVSAGEDNEQGS